MGDPRRCACDSLGRDVRRGSFLRAAGRKQGIGASTSDLDEQLLGIDLHAASLDEAMRLLEEDDLDGLWIGSDCFAVNTPDILDAPLPLVDALVGNPTLIRY